MIPDRDGEPTAGEVRPPHLTYSHLMPQTCKARGPVTHGSGNLLTGPGVLASTGDINERYTITALAAHRSPEHCRVIGRPGVRRYAGAGWRAWGRAMVGRPVVPMIRLRTAKRTAVPARW